MGKDDEEDGDRAELELELELELRLDPDGSQTNDKVRANIAGEPGSGDVGWVVYVCEMELFFAMG